MNNQFKPADFLQHAEWYCLFGGGLQYNLIDRTPEPCDLEAALILKELRERMISNG